MMKEDFLAKNPHLRETAEYLEIVRKESDRGAVLITCGLLEERLRRILLAFMLHAPAARELVDGANAPMGSFSARIAACYALALISETEHHDLTLMRKIRNDFAHEMRTTFATRSVIDRCALLRCKAHDYVGEKTGPVVVGPLGQFTTAATAIILAFVNRPHYVAKGRRSFSPYAY